DVLHRLFAGRDPARDHQHLVSALLLLGGELEQGQRGPADVEAGDDVEDPHARSRVALVAHATATPATSQHGAARRQAPHKPTSPGSAAGGPATQSGGTPPGRWRRLADPAAARPMLISTARNAAAPTTPSSYSTWS